jgi:hypothetical protein
MGYSLIREKKEQKDSVLYNDSNEIQHIQEASDVAQTIKELNDDKVEADSFSNIDMKTRLVSIEISSIIALDSLVALDFLPCETSFITRSKKRLSVSLNGLGRGEIVQIAQGMKDQQQGHSFLERIGNVFRGGSPK